MEGGRKGAGVVRHACGGERGTRDEVGRVECLQALLLGDCEHPLADLLRGGALVVELHRMVSKGLELLGVFVIADAHNRHLRMGNAEGSGKRRRRGEEIWRQEQLGQREERSVRRGQGPRQG